MRGKTHSGRRLETSSDERLAGGEDSYRVLFENMLDGLAYCRMEFDGGGQPADFVYLDVNQAFGELTGLKDVIGRRVTEVIPGIRASNPELFQVYGRVAQTGKAERFETYVPQLDIWFSISVYSPQRGYFVAVFENVTERKRTAQALENSERRFRALLENSRDQVALMAPDGTLLWQSPSALRTLGYEFDQFVGQSLFPLMHVDDMDRVQRELADLLQEPGAQRTTTFRIRRADGAWRSLEVVASNLLGDPSVGAIVLNYRDITERKQAEDNLRHSEEQYRELFENHPHPMWVYDRDTLAILAVNDAAVEKYGYSHEEFLQMTIRELRPEEDMPRLRQVLAQPLAPLRKSEGVKHRLKGGEVIDVNVDSHRIGWDGHPCALVLAQDVTETRRAEARVRYLSRLYATISQANQAIVRIHDRQELFQKICDVAVEFGEFRLAWIGLLDRETGQVRPLTHAGYEAGYMQLLDINILDPVGRQGPTGTAIRTGKTVFVEDLATDPNAAPWRKPAVDRGYRSYAAVPIEQDHVVVGVLALYAPEASFFNEEEMRLLEEIGQDISFALDGMERESHRQQLEADRSRLLSTIERSLNEIYIFEPESLLFEYVNPGALQNLGYTAAEMQHMTPLDIKPQYSKETFLELVAPLLQREREKIVFETVHKRADGSLYPVEAHLQLIQQEHRRLFLAVILDITERKRAEAELVASERRYRNVLSSMMEGCQILDYDWRWIYVNDTAASHLGHEPADLLMQRMTDLYPTVQQSPVFQTLATCMQERRAQRSEIELVLPDGASHWLELSIQPVPEGLFILSFDISERRRAEQRFRKFFELGLIGMTITSPAKGFLEVNDRVCEMLGYTRDELMQLTWEQLTYPADLPASLEQFNRLLAGELDSYSIEKRFIHKSGRLVHVALSLNAVRAAGGTLEYCVAILEDITERKQAEQRLKASEQNYRSLFNNVPDGVYRTRPDGEMLAANPALVEMLGYASVEDLLPIRVQELYAASEQRPEMLHRIRSDPASRNLEVRLRRKDGKEIIALDNARAIRDEQGDILYFEGTLTDITSRKQAEDALRVENERFQRFVESNIVGIAITNTAGDILVANEYYLRLLGVTREDQQAGKVKWSDFTPPEWLPADERAIRQLRESGVCEPFEKEYQRADGTRVPVYLANAMLPGPGEQSVAFVLDMSEQQRAERRIHQQLQRIAGLREIDRAITSVFDLRLSANSILEQVEKQLDADASAIFTLDMAANTLNCIATRGLAGAPFGHLGFRLGEGLAGMAIMAYQTIHHPDIRTVAARDSHAEAIRREGYREYYGVPLVSKGQLKGILEVLYKTAASTDRESLEYLETLAGQAAIAIDNIQMLDGLNRSNLELIQAYDATIEGWSRALDLRDKETEGHTKRVTDMTLALARKCGVAEKDLTNIRWGGLLHDIGKMGIPDRILLKPGPLTEDEWVLMKKHPQFAFEMLAPIQYLRGALDIPLCHHEKWDGTGYPRGLKGEQIPLPARIFAIVDIWDAVRSDRPYRPAWSEGQALEHIRSIAGSHLDPQVVRAFFDYEIYRSKDNSA